MSKESVLQFIEAANNNPELLSKLNRVQEAEDVLDIASTLGYEFSEPELLHVMQEKQLSFRSDELSDLELEGVVGGYHKNGKKDTKTSKNVTKSISEVYVNGELIESKNEYRVNGRLINPNK
ncbi:MAG: Nif11-like leader peptide family natural product precursor [Cyanobacteria bacterium P01_A01_bin.84]